MATVLCALSLSSRRSPQGRPVLRPCRIERSSVGQPDPTQGCLGVPPWHLGTHWGLTSLRHSLLRPRRKCFDPGRVRHPGLRYPRRCSAPPLTPGGPKTCTCTSTTKACSTIRHGFVAHSMVGWSCWRAVDKPGMLERVPLIPFLREPQRGPPHAIALTWRTSRPGRRFSPPTQRLPRVLNDAWKASAQASGRPPFALRETDLRGPGVALSSATRFCDEPALASEADTIDVSRSPARLMVFLATSSQYVLGRHLNRSSRHRTFGEEDHVYISAHPGGRRDARLVNAVGTNLRYTCKFPDRGSTHPARTRLASRTPSHAAFVLGSRE